MKGKCKLCQKEADLEISHFIPKFVGKWVKKTSITGYLREHNEVAKRQQDIAKEYWLCGECEDKFSIWETKFANKVFFPFVDKNEPVANYDSWMSKFCASLSWRTLTFIRSKNIENGSYNKDPSYVQAVDNAKTHLAKYLLNEVDNLNQYEQHLYPLEKIESTTEHGLPPNINRYFLRTMAMDIIGNDKDIFIVTKIPSFVLLGCVKFKELSKIRSSRIALKKGQISPREYYWPDGFANYMIEQATEVSKIYESIPEKHHERIEEFLIKNPEKAVNSKLFEAFLHDYERFGDKALR
ncbi:hypothetical protein KO528_15675 [Saccharophagus degradans]|uniref:hypothetical protein n=1 Tax=Saccharophagus degradans TaxID=86304 RepID=UPI001C09D6B1|nr:hypothetical protein [Saccharophagus degradans]MBU2986804.1 hypothetical protein [Saccharophagus degradans]